MNKFKKIFNKKSNKKKIAIKVNRPSILSPVKTVQRSILTFIMIPAFVILLRMSKTALFIFIYALKSFAFIEVVRLLDFEKKKTRFKGKLLTWYFMLVADLYYTGRTLGKYYSDIINPVYIEKHLFVCFTLYLIGFISFVCSLRKNTLKSQFLQFGISQIVICIASICCNLTIRNIINGKILLAYPVLLVVANDISAFIIGKFFGRTPLISVSPNKTWEGFFGGTIGTILVSYFLCFLKVRYNILSDKNDAFLFNTQLIQFYGHEFIVKNIYLHSLSFILFASFVAPFGGFFASGFKRALNVKDFSDAIPGHGGFMDRIDCQFLINVFTYVYYYTFVQERILSKKKFWKLS